MTTAAERAAMRAVTLLAQRFAGAPGIPIVDEFPSGPHAGKAVVLRRDWTVYVFDGTRWRAPGRAQADEMSERLARAERQIERLTNGGL